MRVLYSVFHVPSIKYINEEFIENIKKALQTGGMSNGKAND